MPSACMASSVNGSELIQPPVMTSSGAAGNSGSGVGSGASVGVAATWVAVGSGSGVGGAATIAGGSVAAGAAGADVAAGAAGADVAAGATGADVPDSGSSPPDEQPNTITARADTKKITLRSLVEADRFSMAYPSFTGVWDALRGRPPPLAYGSVGRRRFITVGCRERVRRCKSASAIFRRSCIILAEGTRSR